MSLSSTKPKRQRTLPAALRDTPDEPPRVRKSASAKKKQKKESGDNNDSTQLYGLYSTEYADFCSGSWFPITYVGPPVDPAAPPSDVPVAPLLPPVDSTDPILVRWSSKSRNEYDAESLSLAFVRCASEFSRLPVASIKPRKRVLVRDVLESMDFEGVSYWLATIVSEPTTAKKGKKNARATVEVEYQNTMWPPTSVPVDSIYVLPKVKAQLKLVPSKLAPASLDAETEEDEDDDDDAAADVLDVSADSHMPTPLDLHAADMPFAHSSPQLPSDSFAFASPLPDSMRTPMSPPPVLTDAEEHHSEERKAHLTPAGTDGN